MKEGWNIVKLGDIALQMYRGAGIKRDQVTESGVPCIRYGEIYTTYNYAFSQCVSHTNEDLIKPRKYIEKGDLLFTLTGESIEEIGKCVAYLGDEKCLLGGDILAMKHNQCPKFLAYAMASPNAIKQKSLGKVKLKVVHTNESSLRNVAIPLPSLIEQERIVAYLDAQFAKIDAMKANAAKALAEAKALFQTALTEAMTPKEGWKMKKIGDVFRSFSGGTPLKSVDEYYKGGNIPWLRSGEVCKKYIYETEMFITEEGMKNSSAKYYPIDTVVVAMYGATAAQVGILKISSTSNQAVCGLLPNSDNLPEFVYYWFRFRQDFLASQAQGGAQPNISQIKIKNLDYPIMPLPEQERIVTRLDALSAKVAALEANYTQTVAECDALKQALLREVFE